MNRQHLQNLVNMAHAAVAAGKVIGSMNMINCGVSIQAAEQQLEIMQEGQVLTVLTVNKPKSEVEPKADEPADKAE